MPKNLEQNNILSAAHNAVQNLTEILDLFEELAAAIYISDIKGNCAVVRLQAGTIFAASQQNAVRVVSKTATCQISDNIVYVIVG